MAGIRRRRRRPPTKKKALTLKMVERIVVAIPDDLRGLRDVALITAAYWGCLRRSEVVQLDVADLEFEPEGVRVRVNHSKTDQAGVGVELALPRVGGPLCAATALKTWVDASGVSEHLFSPIDRWGRVRDRRLTAQAVALILKQRSSAVGLDASVIAGHSTRRGFISEAARAGVPELEIARQSRHRSVAVLRGYVEHANLWTQSAAVQLARSRRRDE
jgi:integrase